MGKHFVSSALELNVFVSQLIGVNESLGHSLFRPQAAHVADPTAEISPEIKLHHLGLLELLATDMRAGTA